ncbi:MAG TPA: hypothetical protein VLF68_01585 [Candidatus Saccharimonadales bacterium]|nr:hypothetical protein [Candidatus Saccharimonadales bacterium]
MKKLFITFCAVAVLLGAGKTYAQTPTATPTQSAPKATPTSESSVQQTLDQLKNRIASRVAQLNLVEKRGIIGNVTNISGTELTLSDVRGNIRFADVNELTKFSSPSASASFGLSDISKGSLISVLGLYNKESKRLSANFIEGMILPQLIHGAVTTVDAKNFNLQIITDDNKTITVSIENTTKTYAYTKDNGLTKIGFSKIAPSEHVIVIGFPDKKDKTTIIPTRVLLFPDLPKNPKIKADIPTPTPTPLPTVAPTVSQRGRITPTP